MKQKLGIALAGGGIKAFVQIGALRFLEEKGVKFDCIAGTSMGSVIASLVAIGADSEQLTKSMFALEKHFIDKKILLRPDLRILPFAKDKLDGFIDADIVEKMLEDEFLKYGVVSIQDIKTPLAITAVDLISGKLVVFTNVPRYFIKDDDLIVISNISLAQAIRSSCSFPMVFNTKRLEGMQLVDGGVKMNLPVSLLRMMKCKIAVSISMDSSQPFEGTTRISEVAMRILDLTASDQQSRAKRNSNYNLNIDVSDIQIFDVGKGDQLVARGYTQALELWPEIEAAMRPKNVLESLKEEITKYI